MRGYSTHPLAGESHCHYVQGQATNFRTLRPEEQYSVKNELGRTSPGRRKDAGTELEVVDLGRRHEALRGVRMGILDNLKDIAGVMTIGDDTRPGPER
jgi:hypothetical protein